MILDKTVSTNKFVHIDIKKDNKKCIVCWRELPKGSSAKMLIKDDTVYSNSVYCPKGTKHIDNVSDYKEYLRKHKNITDEQKLILLGHKWETYRLRKGYMNIQDVEQVTKAHKEAYASYKKRQIMLETKKLEKLHKTYEQERNEMLQQIVALEEEMNEDI